MTLAWSAKVSPTFCEKTIALCQRLNIANPDWLMACMAFETDATFAPHVINYAGSGATGLIQFMPQTAAALGTSVEQLRGMTAEQQLDYVEKYFTPYKGRLKNLGDVYGAILWPGMIGKPDAYVVFDQQDHNHPARYVQNHGLDTDKNGKITRWECIAKVQQMLEKGLLPDNKATETLV